MVEERADQGVGASDAFLRECHQLGAGYGAYEVISEEQLSCAVVLWRNTRISQHIGRRIASQELLHGSESPTKLVVQTLFKTAICDRKAETNGATSRNREVITALQNYPTLKTIKDPIRWGPKILQLRLLRECLDPRIKILQGLRTGLRIDGCG